MPVSGWSHDARGINLTNARLLAPNSRDGLKSSAEVTNGYRAPSSWKQETKDQLELGNSMQVLTSSWRNTSTAVKDYTSEQVVADARGVSHALKSKITQTTTLRDHLESALREVSSEMAQLASHRAGLEGRLVIINNKMEVNHNRTQVRNNRPVRERTMDDVEHDLLAQQSELTSFSDRCRRAVALVDKAMADLEGCRARLEADLRDKQHAIEVDTAVLHVPVDGSDSAAQAAAAALRRLGPAPDSPKTPHTWVRMTEDNLAHTSRALADATRLRKAVHHSLSNSRALDHKVAASLNRSMIGKLQSTQALRRNIASQLESVRAEETAMQAQRASLAIALEAKRGPLEQAKARWALRRARTDRETVQDSVEAALSQEIVHLNAATQSLMAQVNAADKHLEQLATTIRLLKANLEDKDQSIRIDESAVMLDGRMDVPHPPPSSVASFAMSSVSTARSATLRRIAMLEDEVGRARSERMGLEAGVSELRNRALINSRPNTG